jgi:hypothetical protein
MAKKTLFRLDFESEFRIVGLFCSERDYRLCWLLNRHLGFNFRRAPEFEFPAQKSQKKTLFSVYEYEAPESLHCSFYVVNNRSNEDLLLFNTPPGLDYLLIVKVEETRFSFQELLRKLRTITQLTAAYQLDNVLAKYKKAFLYDFEVFVSQNEITRKRDDGKWIKNTEK